MKQSNRILFAGLCTEALSAGIGAWLLIQMANGSLTTSTSLAETRTTIFSVLGSAMGAVGGILGLLWMIAKKRGS